MLRNLTNVFLNGDDVIEDINTHLGKHIKIIPDNKVTSANTVKQTINKPTGENTFYTISRGEKLSTNNQA